MLNNQQNIFLEQLLELGDRQLAMKRCSIATREFIHWMQNSSFKNEVERIEAYYIDNLTAEISQAGLKKLDYILRHGIKTVTHTTIVSLHPEFGEIKTERRSVKIQDVSMPAIQQAIQLFIMCKVERDVLNNIAALSSRGLLPEHSESLISSTMEEYRSKVKQALKGEYEAVGINEEMLAQIQSLVINGS
jgi:CRISPR/Cas system-associated endoribonuclease Cas2